jgi:hypothetical protein
LKLETWNMIFSQMALICIHWRNLQIVLFDLPLSITFQNDSKKHYYKYYESFGFWFFGCHGLLLNFIILTLFETETSPTILTPDQHDPFILGHVGGLHIDFPFHYHLLLLLLELWPQSKTILNSNVNTTKPGSKALWEQWQLLEGFQWASAQLLKYKERKKERIDLTLSDDHHLSL